MGNYSISTQKDEFQAITTKFENSQTVRLHQIENGTLIKCAVNNQLSFGSNKDSSQQCSQSLFYLQKLFITDSQEQYKLLARYLEKQSILFSQSQSSQMLKIVKIHQQSQKGLCSNHYLIRVLFEYSDITIRDQIRVRSMKKIKNQQTDDNPYFRYEDLCSIMFACISSLYAVEKMKENLKTFMKNKLSSGEYGFKHLDSLLHQYKFNIPFNLDRIIIMPDGTIKVMHPLLLDHDNRAHYSNKFYYSPQKMKDFLLDDGRKGRIFETAIIVLQCALIQNTQQMNKIYNGYCINEKVLNEKIQNAIKIYSSLENLTQDDMKLFTLIKKMTKVEAQQRIDLNLCINEAEDLFQLNKKLKQSITENLYLQRQNHSTGRMSVQELQFFPSNRMTLKTSPLQNSTAQNTAHSKYKVDGKITSRQTSVGKTIFREQRQNPQVQVSNFEFYNEQQKKVHKNHQKTNKNPFDSLLINNENQNFFRNNNQECLQSFLGQGSNLYETQKINFLESKFQYGKFFCNPIRNSIIEERIDSMNSQDKKFSASVSNRDSKYQKMVRQLNRNSSGKKDSILYQGLMRQDLCLRSRQKESLISVQKFMDNEKIYSKYRFIEKSGLKESIVKQKCSFMEIKDSDNFEKQESLRCNNHVNRIPYTFSHQSSQDNINQNSKNSNLFSTDKKSQVLEKITSYHINQRVRRHKILR